MADLVRPFILPSGAILEIEAIDHGRSAHPSGSDYKPAGPGQKLVAKAAELQAVIPGLSEIVDGIISSISMPIAQSLEFSVELGIKVGASGNLIVAGGTAECNFKVSLKYPGGKQPNQNVK